MSCTSVKNLFLKVKEPPHNQKAVHQLKAVTRGSTFGQGFLTDITEYKYGNDDKCVHQNLALGTGNVAKASRYFN